ncbi:unnamed protein product [Chrysoparadoxa australica]
MTGQWSVVVCVFLCVFTLCFGFSPSSRTAVINQRHRGPNTNGIQCQAQTQSASVIPPAPAASDETDWDLWFTLPIAPYSRRKTFMEEVVPGKIWTFDQAQGILYVIVPVRMTVVKLEGGGLFVHAPVAPTKECIKMVRALEEEHGPVKQIVLPTLGLEHKVFAGPFAQKFPQAEVWVTPGQYSFPLNLPLSFLGFGARKINVLPREGAKGTPWEGEMEHAVLGPFVAKSGIGAFGETTFFHRATGTIMVTDVVVKVTPKIPKIVDEDPRSMLFHSRDNTFQGVQDTPAVRAKGWRRITQFALTFQPGSLDVLPLGQALKDGKKSPAKDLGWGGLFPFEWTRDDSPTVKALSNGLLCAPILQVLILNRNPVEVAEWLDIVTSWSFNRVIPCHLQNNVKATPQEFRAAFDYLREEASAKPQGLVGLFQKPKPSKAPLPDADLELLRGAEELLVSQGTLFPAEPKLPAQ